MHLKSKIVLQLNKTILLKLEYVLVSRSFIYAFEIKVTVAIKKKQYHKQGKQTPYV